MNARLRNFNAHNFTRVLFGASIFAAYRESNSGQFLQGTQEKHKVIYRAGEKRQGNLPGIKRQRSQPSVAQLFRRKAPKRLYTYTLARKNFSACALTHVRENTFPHAHLRTCAKQVWRMRTCTLARKNVYACALAHLRENTFTHAHLHTCARKLLRMRTCTLARKHFHAFAAIECF